MSVRSVTVASADGTPLAVRVVGDGSPLVLVHGTAASKECWQLVEPLLVNQHTVWTYDRRGRGESGDAAEYAFEREVDDVLAVATAAGDAVHLLGHSFGACCALDAATALAELQSLILYEAPIHQDRRADAVRRALIRLDTGDREGALLIFLGDVAGLSDAEIGAARSVPEVWDRFLDAAPTCGREMHALANQERTPSQFDSVMAPTLYLTGEKTETPVYASAEDIHELIPHTRIAVLADQRHIAFATNPMDFAQAVLGFTAQRTLAHGT